MNIDHDNLLKILETLSPEVVEAIAHYGQSAKITAGNEQETIIAKLFDNLGLPGIRATLGEKIENTTRKNNFSNVDVTLWHYDKPIIGFDVKNGSGASGTESADSRSIDVKARHAGAVKKGYMKYVYLHTPAASRTPLDHVNIAVESIDPSSSCELCTALMEEGNENLQRICKVLAQLTGQHIDTSMIMTEYNKLNPNTSLKDKVTASIKKERHAAQVKEEKRAAKETKRAAFKR